MAVLVIPVMQADGPESFMMHRGSKAKSHATLVKSEKFGAKHRMSKGSTYWDFEDASQLDDWTFVDNDGDGFNWEYHNNYGLEYGLMSCFSGDGMMRSLSYSLEESSVLFPDNGRGDRILFSVKRYLLFTFALATQPTSTTSLRFLRTTKLQTNIYSTSST